MCDGVTAQAVDAVSRLYEQAPELPPDQLALVAALLSDRVPDPGVVPLAFRTVSLLTLPARVTSPCT